MKTHVNLLSTRMRYRLLVRARVRQWAVLWLAGAVIAVLTECAHLYRVQAREGRLTQQREQSEPLQRMQRQNGGIRHQLTVLSGRQGLLQKLKNGQLPFRLISVVSQSARACADRVRVEDFSIARIEPAPVAAPPAKGAPPLPAPDERVLLTLQGFAVDNIAVADFARALRASGVFSTVELKSSVQTEFASIAGRTYLIECALQ